MSQRAESSGWFKSSRSTGGSDNCVEVRMAKTGVQVRDSKAPDEALLGFGSGVWATFVASLRSPGQR